MGRVQCLLVAVLLRRLLSCCGLSSLGVALRVAFLQWPGAPAEPQVWWGRSGDPSSPPRLRVFWFFLSGRAGEGNHGVLSTGLLYTV